MKSIKTKKIASFFAVLLFAGTFFSFAPTLEVSALGWETGIDMVQDSSNLPENYVHDVILTLLQWLLLIFTFLAVIAFVVAGIMFLTAGSNPPLAENAKRAVTLSIIGIAVGISGYVILSLIDSLLRGTVQGV